MPITEDLVSAIIPTYNDAEYLPRALESVNDQTYENIEAIVVDSAGSDFVKEIVSGYNFARYIYDDPKGPAAARNTGIDKSNGEYIAFLDADDMWLSKKTELQIKQLRSDSADFVYSDQYKQFALEQISPEKWKYDESIELCSDKQPHVSYFREVNGIGSRTVMCRKECLDNELFWEELQLREDPNLWVRILSDFKSTRVNIPLAVKFYRDGSITNDQELMYSSRIESIQMLVDRYPELAPYENRRISEAKIKYGGYLVKKGDRSKARKLMWDDPENIPLPHKILLTFATFPPVGGQLVYYSSNILIQDGFHSWVEQVRKFITRHR